MYKRTFAEHILSLLLYLQLPFNDRNSASNHTKVYNYKVCQAIYTSLDKVYGGNSPQVDLNLTNFWTTEVQ